MPTRKLPDSETRKIESVFYCRHPDHNIPSMQVFDPGDHEHECPACHKIQRFHVNKIVC